MANPENASDERVLLGRIGAAHGLRGQVRIQSFTEDPLAIADFSPLLTSKPDLQVSISKVRLAKNIVVATLDNIEDRTAAEALNGVELFARRAQLPAADNEEEFLLIDLIGVKAVLEDGTLFGTITDVPNYGSGDLLEILLPSGQSELLPFTRQVAPNIDLANGQITICPPGEVMGEEGR